MSGLHPFYGATIANTTALVLMIFLALLSGHGRLRKSIKSAGVTFAIFSGLCNSIALVSFFMAMSIGKIALVVPITCIYPLFTLLGAYLFMKETERIDLFTIAGTFLIVVGVILTI